MSMFHYCDGIIGEKYCPLCDICYRCCECKKSRNLKRNGSLNKSFAQYDWNKKECPFYLNKAQWIVIKMLSK